MTSQRAICKSIRPYTWHSLLASLPLSVIVAIGIVWCWKALGYKRPLGNLIDCNSIWHGNFVCKTKLIFTSNTLANFKLLFKYLQKGLSKVLKVLVFSF